MPYKNTEVNTINAAQGGKVGCNTDEYTTAFLYSDWCVFCGIVWENSTIIKLEV